MHRSSVLLTVLTALTLTALTALTTLAQAAFGDEVADITHSPDHASAETAGVSVDPEYEWRPRKIKHGISVYSRNRPGSDYQEFKATVEVPGTVASALAILNDTQACTKWLHRCIESRVLTEVSNVERIFYQATGLAFPAQSRDAVLRALVSYKTDRSVLITVTALSEPPGYSPEEHSSEEHSPQKHPPQEKHIRITNAYGSYLLEPLLPETDMDGDDNGNQGRVQQRSRLTWQQYIDPAGSLPSWIVNRMLTDLPFKSLQAFRKLITTQPYRDTTFGYDSEGIPDSLIKPPDDSRSSR